MKRLLFFILFMPVVVYSQTGNSLKGTISGLENRTVTLLSFYGERNSMVDSVRTDGAGSFSFRLSSNLAPGLYRLRWSKDGFIDIILNHENVELRSDAQFPGDSLLFTRSTENQVFYFLQKRENLTQGKMELLQQLMDYYPEKDAFYRSAVVEYEKVQDGMLQTVDSLNKKHPDLFALRIYRIYQAPYLPSSLTRDDRLTYLKAHFFDRVDFQDTAILRSNAWPNKTIAYLSLYSNPRLQQKQLEVEFIKAVTIMLSAAGVNADVFKFLLDYLVTGFDKFHLEDVITYIAENFEDPYSCENTDKKSALQKKLETFKKIATGQPAPDFEIPDDKGKPVRLSALNTEYLLIVFWSGECPHCTDMMPKVKAIYDVQKEKRMEILSVSLDTSRTSWTTVLEQEKLNWINVCDLKGFDGIPADLYNIYATPTMFLLDRNKKILAKPISYRELEIALRENGLL
jgi:peroxiredoxin